MGNPRPTQPFSGVATALVVTGFGIGWLAGLAVSPVVSIVITSVTGVAAAVVTALSGLKEEPDDPKPKERRQLPKIEIWPLAILLFGMVIGSTLGILARNNHLFGSDVTSEIKKWTDVGVPKEAVMERLFGKTATYSPYTQPYTGTLQIEIERWTSLGLPKEQVVTRLFEQYFSASQSISSTATAPLMRDNRTGTLLFATAIPEECVVWQGLIDKGRYDDLATEVKRSEVKPFRELPAIVTDTVKLATIVGEVLCADTQ